MIGIPLPTTIAVTRSAQPIFAKLLFCIDKYLEINVKDWSKCLEEGAARGSEVKVKEDPKTMAEADPN